MAVENIERSVNWFVHRRPDWNQQKHS